MFNPAIVLRFALCCAGVSLAMFSLAGSQPQRESNNARTDLLTVPVAGVASTSGPPVVTASTYLGGPGTEITWACATDAAGNVYIAGDANEAEFPITANALQKTYADGGQDGFVAKFDKNGNLLWSTFLGGRGSDKD